MVLALWCWKTFNTPARFVKELTGVMLLCRAMCVRNMNTYASHQNDMEASFKEVISIQE